MTNRKITWVLMCFLYKGEFTDLTLIYPHSFSASLKSNSIIIASSKLINKVIPNPIDVPQPLINDLCIFLFQNIDAECVK